MEQLSAGEWGSLSPLTISDEGARPPPPQRPLGFNYRRDVAHMTSEEPMSLETITIQDSHTTPNVNIQHLHTGEPDIRDSNATSSSGVSPIAIPYMALHNVGCKNTSLKGRKWVIMPMVAGFESNFIANTLQGLLCLPGCVSVMMGEPCVGGSSSGGGGGEPLAVPRSPRSSSPIGVRQDVHGGANGDEEEEECSESLAHARSASPEEADERSLGSSVSSDRSATGDRSPRSPGDDGDAGKGSVAQRGKVVKRRDAGRSTPALRGGIRCQWGTRVKTPASRMYASYVMDHLLHANIHLKTSPCRVRQTSGTHVTDTQVDDAEELESLRGQSATVPRCLAPVALPEKAKSAPQAPIGSKTSTTRSLLGLLLAHATNKEDVCTYTCGTASAACAESSERTEAMECTASVSVSPSPATTATITAVVPPPEKAAVLVGLEEGHSSDDNSPTPSSQEEEEEEEGGGQWGSTENNRAGQASGVRHGAAAARMTNRGVAQDASRYVCFASNSVDNMPSYPLPKLQSEDLVDLAAFMVVRSSLEPDEATDLNLGTHLLGDPHLVQGLPPGQRAALLNRAARLMEAAVFLQV
ncbi:hypothetical protein JKF63_07281 [Porcisia hertigi]|uniref:Uncharacterized protein n=1 Tax=Porcisia hertigi TaxID=2761500 RepID=A0A836LLG9_9TRYP|nr:hypothetical protein JKF63_07281 [Porcisia hertigi]